MGEILIALVLVLAVVTLAGHGLWLLVAAVLRGLGRLANEESILPFRCPRCGMGLAAAAVRCPACGHVPVAKERERLQSDLAATVRQLGRLVASGTITEEEHAKLQQAVAAEQHRLAFPFKERTGEPPTQEPAAPRVPGPPPVAASHEPAQRDALEEREPARSFEPVLPDQPGELVRGRRSISVSPAGAPVEPPYSAPSQRSISALLQAFMEEKNIRWGELVAGMLIVGCSVGLVISLWATLTQWIPYFPALVFMAMTAAIHGAGLYTLRRWKLRSTSRGLLVIGTLLVPLNFLALVALAEKLAHWDPFFVVGAAAGLGVFGVLTYLSSRELVPQWRWLVLTGVLGPSASQLIIRRLAAPDAATWLVIGLALPALACYLIACVGMLVSARQWKSPTARDAAAIVIVLGLAAFSLVLSEGLLVYRVGDVRAVLEQLAPLVSLAGIPVLALGLLLHHRITEKDQAATRTAGTAMAVLGAGVLLGALGLAWPSPERLVAVGIVNFVVLSTFAFACRLPVLHLAALPCLGLAFLTGFHLVTGQFAEGRGVLELLLAGRSGLLLVPLIGAVAAGSGLLARRRQKDARNYALAAAGLAVLSVLIAGYSGFLSAVDAHLSTLVFAFYAAVLLVGNGWLRQPAVGWTGSALLLAGIVQGLGWNDPLAAFLDRFGAMPERPILVGLLLHGTVALLGGAALAWRGRSLWDALVVPLSWSAAATSGLALFSVLDVHVAELARSSAYAFWLAAIWLVVAVLHRWPTLFSASQAVATLGLIFGVTAVCTDLPWWRGLERSLLDIRHIQAHGIALAIWSLLWTGARRLTRPWTPAEGLFGRRWPAADLLAAVLAALACALLAGRAVAAILVVPGALPATTARLGSVAGFGALLLSGVAVAGYIWDDRRRWFAHLLAATALAAAALAAAAMAPWNTPANWLSYHALMGTWLAVAWLAGAAAWLAESIARRSELLTDTLRSEAQGTPISGFASELLAHIAAIRLSTAWATTVASLVVLLAVRAGWSDPLRPWWAAGSTLAVALLFAALGLGARSQVYAYASVLLSALASTLVWIGPWIGLWQRPLAQAWVELVEANLIAATLAAGAWLLAELWWQRRRGETFDQGGSLRPTHHTVPLALLGVGALMAVVCTFQRSAVHVFAGAAGVAGFPVVSNLGGAATLAVLGLVFAGTLWDCTARHALPALYALGLAGLVLALDAMRLDLADLFFASGVLLAGYVLLTGLIWTQRHRIAELGRVLTVPSSESGIDRTKRWLPQTNLFLAAAVLLIELVVSLTFGDTWKRFVGAEAIVLIVPGMWALAQGERRARFQYFTLLVACAAAVALSWAFQTDRAGAQFWLQLCIRLLVMLAAATAVYGLALSRILSDAEGWAQAARRAATTTGGLALAALLVVLATEVAWFRPGVGAPVTNPQIAIVTLVLLGQIAAAISLAMQPGRDPLGLSERGRMLYVYTAEVILALLFAHVYLTMPWLFRGYLQPYWPLIVMAIAYAGVGLGELFERTGWKVLAEPLQRTGVFLPLLPVLGFWAYASKGNYSTLLFIVGLLYAVLAFTHRSFRYSIASALAGNAALWALWGERDVTFLGHPQFWLIPPALSALVAAHVNRDRLSEAQLTGIRYLSVVVIYVSSTAEMFLTGVGESLWLPLVLCGMSVAGVLAGILLRVRAFLYLGASFLLVSIVSMVWHAAQNIGHVWPWWAFGIIMGLGILALFAAVEKKRNEWLRLVDELRHWEQ